MTYSAGGLIEASDFNLRNGAAAANVSGQINTVWSTGNGNAGYGQTAGANVSVGGTVNASDWATLINNLNAARKHQSGGSYSNLTVPTASSTITFNSSLDTTLTSAYTNRLTAALNGTTVTGSNYTYNIYRLGGASLLTTRSGKIVFSTADAARYFFNAGGKFNLIVSAVDNSGGSVRSTEMRDVINAAGGFTNYAGYTNSGRSGTGETVVANDMFKGYFNVAYNTTDVIVYITSDYPDYAGMYCQLAVFNNSNTTTNGANGSEFWFKIVSFIPDDDLYSGSVNVDVTARIDTIPPSTVYLANSWGTPTITWVVA
jgi:hypothetical protein